MLPLNLHKVMAYGISNGKQLNSYSESASGSFTSKLSYPLQFARLQEHIFDKFIGLLSNRDITPGASV